ncbi:MAG: RNA polymerase sigma factor [Ignavibacteriales bacterium]|nr:MAG: RNA polymerase sigma factor [Ignavibacteriales bacterium]
MEKEVRYKQIIKDNQDRIFRICCCYIKDKDERKDVFQNTLINIWKGLDKFDGRAQISTWIYRITVNTSLAHLQSEKRRENIFQTENKSGNNLIEEFPAEELTDKEKEISKLYKCINKLSFVDRTLISLYLEDASTREMSEVLGISEINVRVKIHRVKKELKILMENDEDGLE